MPQPDSAMNLASMITPINTQFHMATARDVQDIEAIIGASLPPDYVTFLQQFGAAMFPGEAQLESPTGHSLGVFVLYAASGERCSVLANLHAHPDYVTLGFVPIADDLFNNRYVLKVSTGEVFFVEYGHGINQSTMVAPSFSVFVKSIEVIPDEAL